MIPVPAFESEVFDGRIAGPRSGVLAAHKNGRRY